MVNFHIRLFLHPQAFQRMWKWCRCWGCKKKDDKFLMLFKKLNVKIKFFFLLENWNKKNLKWNKIFNKKVLFISTNILCSLQNKHIKKNQQGMKEGLWCASEFYVKQFFPFLYRSKISTHPLTHRLYIESTSHMSIFFAIILWYHIKCMIYYCCRWTIL